MPKSRSHDREYIEPERHDELSSGVVSPSRAEGQQREGRQLTRADAAKGGATRKGRTFLSHEIRGQKLSPTSQTRARNLRRALSGEIAATVGGGRCGVIASLLLKFAAQKTAAAEEAFERGEYEGHRKLSESARMDVLYAREHAAKEASAMAATSPADGVAAMRALVLGTPSRQSSR